MKLDHLIQVVYFSDCSDSTFADPAEALCARFEQEHIELGITGFIFALGGYFVSVLEGGHDDVLTRMEKIASDPGHQRMIILREGAIERRQFASWKSISLGLNGEMDYDRSGAQAFAARLSKGLRMAAAG